MDSVIVVSEIQWSPDDVPLLALLYFVAAFPLKGYAVTYFAPVELTFKVQALCELSFHARSVPSL